MPTAFQQRVWNYLKTIPAGQVRTYTQVAKDIDSSSAVRAVASACAKNPNLISTPCHRVIRSDGSLGGYSGPGGLAAKIKLLQSEGLKIVNNKIVLS